MTTDAKPANHMDQHAENRGELIKYDLRFDSYSISVRTGVSQQISFCPWCGQHLPASQRKRWFDELEALGIDPLNQPYPGKYETDEWRRASFEGDTSTAERVS